MQVMVAGVGKKSGCGSCLRDGLDAGWDIQLGSECVLRWLRQRTNFLVLKFSENFPFGMAWLHEAEQMLWEEELQDGV